jgi:hypothetical protein
MTLWAWIKSMINKADVFFGHNRTKRKGKNNPHHCPRYYIRHVKQNSSRVRWKKSFVHMNIFYMFASQKITTKDKKLRKDAHQLHFDSDSFIIGIDNHASRSISNNIDHFSTALRLPKNGFIQGVGGELLQVKGEGTLVWHIEDDSGRTHKITIKESLHVPKAPICLLSPQHWSQSADDKNPNPHGTWCADYHDCLVLKWDQEQYQRTIPWDRRTNVARLRSAAGTTKYRIFLLLSISATKWNSTNTSFLLLLISFQTMMKMRAINRELLLMIRNNTFSSRQHSQNNRFLNR